MEKRDEKGRFVPGTSGNPNGRPKFSIISIIKDELQRIPKGEKENWAQLFVKKYMRKAYQDVDGIAFRDIIDRIDGKPRQHVTMANEKDTEWLEIFKEIADEIKQETERDPEVRHAASPENNDS